MPLYPTDDDVAAYLGATSSWTLTEIGQALAAETAAQQRVCAIPVDADPANPTPLPDDLAEAVKRRVAHNLALRALPLGVQASLADGAVATNRVGGTDAEVGRLERPWRKRVLG